MVKWDHIYIIQRHPDQQDIISENLEKSGISKKDVTFVPLISQQSDLFAYYVDGCDSCDRYKVQLLITHLKIYREIMEKNINEDVKKDKSSNVKDGKNKLKSAISDVKKKVVEKLTDTNGVIIMSDSISLRSDWKKIMEKALRNANDTTNLLLFNYVISEQDHDSLVYAGKNPEADNLCFYIPDKTLGLSMCWISKRHCTKVINKVDRPMKSFIKDHNTKRIIQSVSSKDKNSVLVIYPALAPLCEEDCSNKEFKMNFIWENAIDYYLLSGSALTPKLFGEGQTHTSSSSRSGDDKSSSKSSPDSTSESSSESYDEDAVSSGEYEREQVLLAASDKKDTKVDDKHKDVKDNKKDTKVDDKHKDVKDNKKDTKVDDKHKSDNKDSKDIKKDSKDIKKDNKVDDKHKVDKDGVVARKNVKDSIKNTHRRSSSEIPTDLSKNNSSIITKQDLPIKKSSSNSEKKSTEHSSSEM